MKIYACLAALALAAVQQVSAVPMYYTFEGTVTYVSANGVTSPLAVGETVQYVYMVDSEADGHYTYDGTTYTYGDYGTTGDDYWVDYFYAGYMGGDAIGSDLGGVSFSQSMNVAYDHGYYGSLYGGVYGSNSDPGGYDYVSVTGSGLATQWLEGQGGFNGYNQTYGQNNDYLQIQSSLTLTSISNENPLTTEAVPEPGTMALMGLGLAGLAARRRRKA